MPAATPAPNIAPGPKRLIREPTQPGDPLHILHDMAGNRIAEYSYTKKKGGSSTLIREYLWLDGQPLAVVEGGVIYHVCADHIGRPVFATNGAGSVVWTASYLPFGGVLTSTGALLELRLPREGAQAPQLPG